MVNYERLLKPLVLASIFLAILATTAFILSGYLYRWEVIDLTVAMAMLSYSAYSCIVLLIGSVIVLFLLKISEVENYFKFLVGAAILLTATVTASSYYWYNQGQTNPPIHDISTDLYNPPRFQAILPYRINATNPAAFAGRESAELQRQHFPDIRTIRIDTSPDSLFIAALNTIESRRWNNIHADTMRNTIEATHKLIWFGFEDDVIIRISAAETGANLDIRSKSRVGRSDLGMNARRIRALKRDIERELRNL